MAIRSEVDDQFFWELTRLPDGPYKRLGLAAVYAGNSNAGYGADGGVYPATRLIFSDLCRIRRGDCIDRVETGDDSD